MATGRMNARLSPDEYIKKSPSERMDYICNKLNLKENYLLGTIDAQYDVQNYFLVTKLINPYTGAYINTQLITGAPVTSDAICRDASLEKVGLEANQMILFKFHTKRDASHNVIRGELLTIDKDMIIPIEHADDVLRELEITIEDVVASGQMETGFRSVFFISNFYQRVIVDKTKGEFERIKAKQESNKNEWKRLQKREQKLSEIQEKIAGTTKALEKLGFHFDTHEERDADLKINTSFEKPETEGELLGKIQQQLAVRKLQYDRDVLRQFYCALKTNQFVILSGPSGTGKTSLVSAFAEVTSSIAKIIPVQPSWTDKQDLLGFYNPIRQQYVPSLFLDALVEAKNNPDVLYLVLLDELNLAQIEYYLADVLSLKEQKNTPIELYSRFEYEENRKEIEWYIHKCLPHIDSGNIEDWAKENLHISSIEQFAYAQRHRNISRYPWSFEIPKNVRIIGTMNIDGTVRALSPKVIDRSFMITIEKQKSGIQPPAEKGVFSLKTSDFEVDDEIQSFEKPRQDLEKSIGENVASLNAGFNNRVENHIDLYATIAHQYGIDHKKLLDELISMKILPRINFLLEQDTVAHVQLVGTLRGLVGENSLSFKKALDMSKKAERTRIFSYWS